MIDSQLARAGKLVGMGDKFVKQQNEKLQADNMELEKAFETKEWNYHVLFDQSS